MDNVEAMYRIEFESNVGDSETGYGIVVLETERVFGGDSAFMYIGKFRVENGVMSVDVHCKKDRDIGELESIFGDDEDEYDLHLEGTVVPKEFILEGYKTHDRSKRITVKLIRSAELP